MVIMVPCSLCSNAVVYSYLFNLLVWIFFTLQSDYEASENPGFCMFTAFITQVLGKSYVYITSCKCYWYDLHNAALTLEMRIVGVST